MPHRLLTVLAALVLVPAALVGCSSSDDGGGGRVADLLGQVPDTAGARQLVTVVDLEAARDAAGIDQPAAGAGDDAYAAYSKLFTTADGVRGVSAITPPLFERSGPQIAHWRTEAGFTLFDVDAAIEAGQPPDVVSVVEGRIDADRVVKALGGTATDRDGEQVVSIGKDGEIDVEHTSAARPLGESLRVAVDDGRVRWARTTRAVDGSIDAGHGGTSLADDDDFGAAADALDGEHVYQALLTGRPADFGIERVLTGRHITQEQLRSVLAEVRNTALHPWVVAGVGDAIVDGKARGVVVLVHRDDDAAKENEARFRTLVAKGTDPVTQQRWSSLFSDVDVHRDGRTVVATMTGRPQLLIRQLVRGGDLLATA